MSPSLRRYLPPAIAGLLVLGLLVIIWMQGPKPPPPLVSLVTFQGADAPLTMPQEGAPDFRFDRLSAWQRVILPQARRFSAPLGAANGALTYNAQAYWELNEGRGGHHTGDDLNGIGGMNTDLGDPVFSVADGLVVFAGEPSPGWGKIVIVAHRLADERIIQSMYAHLDQITVPLNSMIARGQQLGTVGTANGYYPAHLHFELRAGAGVAINGAYREQPLDCLEPAGLLAELGAGDTAELAPAPLAVVLDGELDLQSFEFSGKPERVAEILGEP